MALCSRQRRFGIAQAGQKRDPGLETAGNLANVGLKLWPKRREVEMSDNRHPTCADWVGCVFALILSLGASPANAGVLSTADVLAKTGQNIDAWGAAWWQNAFVGGRCSSLKDRGRPRIAQLYGSKQPVHSASRRNLHLDLLRSVRFGRLRAHHRQQLRLRNHGCICQHRRRPGGRPDVAPCDGRHHHPVRFPGRCGADRSGRLRGNS